MVSGYAREIRFFQCCNLHNIIFIIQYIGHPSPVARPGKKYSIILCLGQSMHNFIVLCCNAATSIIAVTVREFFLIFFTNRLCVFEFISELDILRSTRSLLPIITAE